jgi:hypothetical protein
MRPVRLAPFLIAALLALCPRLGRAEIQREGPEVWPSKHELSAHLGYHLSFGGQVGDPHGVTVNAEYAYRFHPLVWFDVQVAQLFGFGARDGACLKNTAALCYRGGWMTQLDAGVKLKFVTKVPLVVEVPILLGLNGLYNRECGDDGVAIPTLRTGAGVKYFLKPRIGIGANVNIEMGPAFHDATPCKGGGRYTDFYGGVDFTLGAEFIL